MHEIFTCNPHVSRLTYQKFKMWHKGKELMKRRYPVKPPVAIGDAYEEHCRHCGGSGYEPGLGDLTCRECFGRGRNRWRIEECETCVGKGSKHFGLTKCPTCQGRGWTRRDVG